MKANYMRRKKQNIQNLVDVVQHRKYRCYRTLPTAASPLWLKRHAASSLSTCRFPSILRTFVSLPLARTDAFVENTKLC